MTDHRSDLGPCPPSLYSFHFSRFRPSAPMADGPEYSQKKKKPGNDLLSHSATQAVPSAHKGLTSVFGMGTGVSPSSWLPGFQIKFFKFTKRQERLRYCLE